MAQITHECHAFEKDLGQHDRRAHVEVNPAAIHSSYELSETTKVSMRRSAEGGAVKAWMEMCDVAADSDVCGKGNFRFVSSTEKRIVAMLWITCKQSAADGFAETDLISRAVACGAVQQLARFFSAAEYAFRKRCVYVFGSRANHGDLCVVDQHGPVRGDSAYESLLH